LTREEFSIIARTFLAVFPQVSLWRDDFYPDRPVVALIGQLAAQSVDLARVRESLLRLPDWSQDPQLATTQGFLMLYAGDLTEAADLFASASLNTDDRPLIEFLAPRLTRVTATGDKDWFTGEALATFYDSLDARLADNPGPFIPVSEEIRAARRAGTALFHYALATARHDDTTAARFQEEVRTLVPTVIRAAEEAGKTPNIADARQELAGLRAEQEQALRRLGDMQRRLGELTTGEDDSQ
jgi:spermidine synthase